MKISIVKFSSKDLEKVSICNESEPLFVRHLAFAGISMNNTDFANVCFECIDNDRFLINLTIGIAIHNDNDFINTYSNVPLTGLLHTMSGVSHLSIVDLFRKTKYMGKEYYSVICWDAISSPADKDGHMNMDNSIYYKVYLTRDQFYYIQAYLRDLLTGEYIDYFSNDVLLGLTSESNSISIDNPKDMSFEILGVDYPKKSNMLFRKEYYELDILMKVNDKFCVLWSMSYNPTEIKEILKNKKYKPISIDDVYDYQIYKSVKYLVVDYAINADNPIQKIVIYSNNIGTAVDENDIYISLDIHKQLYINWIEKIYELLTK